MNTNRLEPGSNGLRRLPGVWQAAGVTPAGLPVALAALIYLRWASPRAAAEQAAHGQVNTSHTQGLWASIRSLVAGGPQPSDWTHHLRSNVVPALRRLPDAPATSWIAKLSRLAASVENLSRLPPALVREVCKCVALQPLDTSVERRLLLADFDAVLDASQGKAGGEHRTPKHIIELMVALADPRSGERVYDPCFGSAGLLTAAYEYALDRQSAGFMRRPAAPPIIAGAENSEAAFVIGLTRLMLAGVEDAYLERVDSLDQDPWQSAHGGRFDVVLANPPWGVPIERERIISRFPVPMRESSGLFVQRALDLLGPDGRAVVVVPESLLFQTGPQQELRRLLLERHAVEAVVSLPAGSFLPYTAVKSSILALRRRGPTRRVRMVDASFVEVGGTSGFGPEAIARIAEDARSHTEASDAWDVSADAFASLDWDLSVRRHENGDLTRVLDSMRGSIPVVSLGAICEIVGGRTTPRDGLLANPGGESKVPYVRIRDLREMGVGRTSSWVAHAALSDIDPALQLQLGDVLLSKSGTIGKVAVVAEEAVGGVASAGLFILRVRDARLDPYFLAAYLDSKACRAWLNSRARGATIQHLRQGVVAELPVPLPPERVQRAVVDENREHRVDSVAYLAQLSGQGRRDAIGEWADRSLRSMFPEASDATLHMDLYRLDAFAREVQQIRNQIVHAKLSPDWDAASDLLGWLMALYAAVEPLRGIETLPPGSVQYAVLREAAYKLQAASALLDERKAEHAHARRLTLGLARELAKLSERLLVEAKLAVHAPHAEVEAGTTAEIELLVRNEGALPLRDVQVSALPNWGRGRFSLLERGQDAPLLLRGDVAEEPGDFAIVCDWRAYALDGRLLSGRAEVPLRAVGPSMSSAMPAAAVTGASPYVCGDPIRPDRDDVFFGREKLVDDIRRQVIRSGNVILLEGNRRAGKSSILRHLEGPTAIPGWLGIYCSLQGAEGSSTGVGVPTVEVFREIAKSIAQGLAHLGGDVPLPDGTVLRAGQKSLGVTRACRKGIGEASPFGDFREYLEATLAVAKERGCSLLLMLDEFDKLQEGIDHGITSPQVPENIRFLVQTYPGLSAILTGSRRLKRLREEYWSALFGLGTRFSVTALPEEAARRLVVEPVKGLLTFSDAAVTAAVWLVARQPFLLQCLCSRIFELAANLGQSSVTVDVVEKAADTLIVDNEHFASLWDYSKSDRRRLILAICQRDAEGPDVLRLGVLEERLVRLGVSVTEAELTADLEFLRELEVLDKAEESAGGAYHLAIPLMGMWIERQQDFDVLVSRARIDSEDNHD